jgi:prepilin-type N-terminal cleavage/methylation domain-containing protein
MNIFKFKNIIKEEKGMTLIELLVVIIMLSLTMGVVAGIFNYAVKGQARALTSQQLMDQSSYAIEYMGRALRMAKKDENAACTDLNNYNYYKTREDNGIVFMNYNGECQEFYLATTTDGGQIKEKKGENTNDLTSGEIDVVSFNIGPSDSWGQDDDLQPRVTIFLNVRGKREMLKIGEQPMLKIQTTISQRNIDTFN